MFGGSKRLTKKTSITAEIDEDQVKRLSNTQSFDVGEYLVTRRDTSFPVTLRSQSKLTVKSVTLDYKEREQVELEVESTSTRVYATIINVSNGV